MHNKLSPEVVTENNTLFFFTILCVDWPQLSGSSFLCHLCSLTWWHSVGLAWKADEVFTQMVLSEASLYSLGFLTAWQFQSS